MRVLVVGAGIAGNALAVWLTRLKHSVTIVEQFSTLRTSGLQIDLRGPGIDVIKWMGLESAFRAKMAPEQGIQIVDSKGRVWGDFPANKTGKGLQSFTTDWEIMRGDFVWVLRDACEETVEYKFGATIVGYEESAGGVEVALSDGTKSTYNLVVGADGVYSRTRKLMLAREGTAENPLHPVAGGSVVAYFTIPTPMRPGEGYNATGYMATGGRGIMTRRSSPEALQVYIGGQPKKTFDAVKRGDVFAEKNAMAEFMHGAGWKTKEIVAGMLGSNDFYCERMAIVQLKRWSRGRVVLLGDAAWCPSANTGMGTTAALVGAYILAGELATIGEDRVDAALRAYEVCFKPYMAKVQEGLLEDDGGSLPDSRLGVIVFNVLAGLASLFRINVAKWMLKEDIRGWDLPRYASLPKAQ